MICEIHIIRKAKVDVVVKIHHEELIEMITFPGKREARGHSFRPLGPHASAVIHHKTGRHGSVDTGKMSDLAGTAILPNPEILPLKTSDIPAVRLFNAYIEHYQVHVVRDGVDAGRCSR